MRKYKKALILLAVLVQCAALGAMCYQREAVLTNGETVFIKTRPVDPRDLFRGDYVRLNYDITRIPLDLVDPYEIQDIKKRERRVYLSYETDSSGLMVPLKLSLKKPSQDRFIRGYTSRSWGNFIRVRYSIEKYFMQQGRGLVLERGKRLEGVRIPLEMEAAIGGDNGIAVLKGFRYARLGMDIVLPRRNDRSAPASFQIKVKLVNASDRPVYILDSPDHHVFQIELINTRSLETYRKEKNARFNIPRDDIQWAGPMEMVVIAPNSLYEFVIDLGRPEYQLIRGEKHILWSDMKYWETARIVYQTPEPAHLQNIDDPEKLWQGRLVSRSFSGYNFRD